MIINILKSIYHKKKFLIFGTKEDTDNIATKLLLNKNNLDNLKYICNNIDNDIYTLIDEMDKIYIGSIKLRVILLVIVLVRIRLSIWCLNYLK